MADQFRYKLLTNLTAKDAPSDTDLVAVGNNGSSALRKLTFASIANAIKTKLLTWTFSNLTTSSKTLPGAVNELNSKIGSRVDITSSTTSTTGTVVEASYVIAGNLVLLHVSLNGMQVSANTNYWVHLPDSFPGNSAFFCPLSASYTGIVCVFRTQGSDGKYVLVQSPTAINNLTLNISGICLKA